MTMIAKSPRRIDTGFLGRTGAIWCLVLGMTGSSSLVGVASGQQANVRSARPPVSSSSPVAPEPSSDYVIGPTDVLSIVFWGERDLSVEVTVRPDGKISLPLLNDVVAAGLTPDQLRRRLTDAARRFLEAPVATVVVRQVNNNRAFITGQVAHPGPFVLSGPTTVLQLIAMAGGFTEFADRKHILITRVERGVQRAYAFNYDDVVKRGDMNQNLILKVGDTVVVP